jgi:predicted nucleic acid-binding protein
MISLDSNLLLYAYNLDSPKHRGALRFIEGLGKQDDVAISEFVLTEFYTLLRNPVVLVAPLSSAEAIRVIAQYRRHSKWALR